MAIRNADGSIILTTEVDQSGLKTGLGSIKKLGATVGKTVLAIGAAAATATVAITKMAVSAYADYEQLVGGVETLFKGSSKKIMDYANDAFYTAGVSANEYMKQVTSFSASLIRSTAGDTDKAADIANMALIDISDNVNKMGSSMESVTLAYQGFAKQQYMLLDNLKLGYGGTKTEMQRLLKDAQAITGVKYDISNLADVYSAIHVIQEELGITGTTAKEAEKTITGSANMMKAAWQNVLSAIAGGGDMDRAIRNLVYSIQKYFENIVPVVKRSLIGIGQLIEKVAPMLVQSVASALIQAIPSLVNAIFQMVVGLAKGIYEGIKALFTGGSGSITVEVKTGVDSVSSSIGDATTGMEDLGDATEEAGKKAKKSLAAFDDLQILAENSEGASNNIADSLGSIGGAGDFGVSILSKADTENQLPPWLAEKLEELKKALDGLTDIDYTNLQNGWKGLVNAIKPLGEMAWNVILWAIENVLVPLTKWSVEEVLPRFLQSLADRVNNLRGILTAAQPALNTFWEKFLNPIGQMTGETFLHFWDEFEKKLGEIEKALADNEFWQDLNTILEVILPVLEEAVKLITKFSEKITLFVTSHIFNDLKTILADVGDIVGIIAALFEGDWEELKKHFIELFFTNRWNDAADDVRNFWENILNGPEAVEQGRKLGEKWGTAIRKAREKATEEFNKWWTEDMPQWFTAEKWQEQFSKITTAISNFFTAEDGFVQTWKNNIETWWTDNVLPHFDMEKWGENFANIVAAVADFFVGETGFVQTWKNNIQDWWDNNVAEWFTAEKWQEIWDNVVDSVTNFFVGENGFVQTWKNKISEWWTNDVTPWFTLEKWEELGKNIMDGITNGINGGINAIIGFLNSCITGFQNMVNGLIDGFNGFVTGWNKVADTNPVLKSLGKIQRIDLSEYHIPALATGAVLPPNKPFMAVVGDQKNGTNIEAPAELIKQMAKEAIAESGFNGQATKEEHYYLNETQLMSIVYKLFKGGERLNGNSLIGGAY